MDNAQVARNRALQAELYGEPLHDLLRRLADTLGLNQARLAETLGLSAPMLSQLIGGQRAKIGNPAVVHRIQLLADLTAEVAGGGVDGAALGARIAEVKAMSGAFGQTTTAARPTDRRAEVRAIQGLLRAVATAEELSAAARLLDRDFPALSEVLRAYGTGRTDEAQAHFQRLEHLV
ncbi:MAG TPA: DNA-binding protein [Actinopolymorphaceae bacterium]|nr:DNA-binding protein [Actinopolymorphaceae bacterium]